MTPLRQALSEADEALTGTLLARMQDVEAARATVRLKKAAQDLLAALDASATTARETPATLTESEVEELDERLEKANAVFSRRIMAVVRAAALPSSPPAAPPATECVNWDECSHGVVPCREFGCLKVSTPAQRRAETPTPCRVCGFK